MIVLRDTYPIEVLNRLKNTDEVVSIFCATGNPMEVILAETDQGKGILGIIDVVKPTRIENEKDKIDRHDLLRKFGYKHQ